MSKSCRVLAPAATLWRYRRDVQPTFDPVVFDENGLARRGALLGRARAGRGNTHFIELDGHALVLRHYRRGGMVSRLSERHYVWTGLARTRAVREFEFLRELESRDLPAPRAYACAVTRHGRFWSGSLVTRRLPGETFAERLLEAGNDGLPTDIWQAVGRCIAWFQNAGCCHADLNAHNVMIDDTGDVTADGGIRVYLLDFDKATWRRSESDVARWQLANVARLRRSLAKLCTQRGLVFDEARYGELKVAWREALAGRVDGLLDVAGKV